MSDSWHQNYPTIKSFGMLEDFISTLQSPKVTNYVNTELTIIDETDQYQQE